MTKNVSTIIGKTIKSINTESCNAWKITFTDGTEKVLWAESSGSYGFGDLYLDDDISGFDKKPVITSDGTWKKVA
jgi:hypothetical protein